MKSTFSFLRSALITGLCLLLLVPGKIQAQYIRTYDVTSGLSENSVKSILQDNDGYIWMATQDGLNVFNGSFFKSYGCSYRPATQEGFSALNILKILLHKDGKRIWGATQSARLLLFDPRTERFEDLYICDENGENQPSLCYGITYDRNGRLWIGTDCGIYIYDEDRNSFRHLSKANSSLQSDLIQCLICDSTGTLWIGSSDGLYKYRPEANDFLPVPLTVNGKERPCHISTIAEGGPDTLWVGTWQEGLASVDRNKNTMTLVHPAQNITNGNKMRIRNLLVEPTGQVWLCSNMGLNSYDIHTDTIRHIVFNAEQPTDNYYSILKDQEGGLWIGTYFKGVLYIPPKSRQIGCYTMNNVTGNLMGSAISSFWENEDGNIWLTAENGGLSLFNPTSQKFLPLKWHGHGINMHALGSLDGQLYIGGYTCGFYRFNPATGQVKHYTAEKYKGLRNNNIFSLYIARDRMIYLGTSDGLSVFNPEKERFTSIPELDGNFIYRIAEDNYGNLWAATYYQGLYRYKKATGEWIHYTHDPEDRYSVSNNKLINLYIDDSERLWICSEGGGMCTYDYENDRFHRFQLYENSKAVNLSVTYAVLQDKAGFLWISSNNGIWKCGENGTVYQHFTHEDGLQSNQYNYCSAYRSSNGRLYFGGINGFNIIDPEKLQNNVFRPEVTVSISYKANGETWHSPKCRGNEKITIPRDISSFTLNFECLSFTAPKKNRIAYKIDQDKEYTYTTESSVSFINFPYGEHNVHVKGLNGDGNWSKNEIHLLINNQPPVLKSKGALTIYMVLALLILVLTGWSINRRREEKTQARLAELRVKQQEEANAAKINFFTNIAHEIKTPVTLIKAPLETVINDMEDGENKKQLDIVYKNTQRLLNLVNQLLDFKKISSSMISLEIATTQPVKLAESVVNRFKATELQGIRIDFEADPRIRYCALNEEGYIKILSNLLSNAVKHTSDHITLRLTLTDPANAPASASGHTSGNTSGHTSGKTSGNTSGHTSESIAGGTSPDTSQSTFTGQMLHLEVQDNGEGIPAEEIPKIFNSFYQINSLETPRMSGFGLGLSLVKLLAERHHGQVYVDKNYTDGCCMCVDIPYLESCPIAERPEADKKSKANAATGNSGTEIPTLLIVDDSADLLEFASKVFSKTYKVLTAMNGRKALEILKTQEVDIVITDVSMPIMNGFELVEAIRKQDALCDIPVLMLTVENTVESKIKGLECGADAYIEKPFSTQHLIAAVENLLNRRKAMQNRYLQLSDPDRQKDDKIFSDRDHEWLERLTEYLLTNIQESDIPIESIASYMNMSQSSLQRKIKGLTGLSPIEFIRIIRLKKAAELLASGNYRVYEVSYLVGFNKPSYFSALFKKQYGILPKDYQENQKKA